MKKSLIICILSIIVFIIVFSACNETTRESTGYIVRDDITMEDMNYFYRGTELIYEHLTMENIIKALGLPHGKHENWKGDIEYNYSTEFGTLHFAEYSGEDYYYIYTDLDSSVEAPESFGYDDVTLDPNQYLMAKRFDINKDELGFINVETTAANLQEKLGAPHDMLYGIDGLPYIGVYTYDLDDGNFFKVTYGADLIVYKAWIEDKVGNEVEVLVSVD